MAALTENEIIDIIYNLYETDNTGWESGSAEYVAARAFCNAAVTEWAQTGERRELWSTLTAAADGTKTTTAGDWDYSCPTNFVRPGSWVRTTRSGVHTFWEVKPPEMIAKLAAETGKYCYFTGSKKAGFVLNFNPKETLVTGDTINYEYYITPTLYTSTSTTSEIPDPYYCVYYALARFLKNDGEDFTFEDAKARELLAQMDTHNIQGVWDVPNAIEEPLILGAGFGT